MQGQFMMVPAASLPVLKHLAPALEGPPVVQGRSGSQSSDTQQEYKPEVSYSPPAAHHVSVVYAPHWQYQAHAYGPMHPLAGSSCGTGLEGYDGNPYVTKKPWTPEEDAKLLRMVAEHGPSCWSQISSHLPGRIGKQCRERWHNHLCPGVKKDSFTEEEAPA